MKDNDPSLRPPGPPLGLDAARWQRLRVRAFGAVMLILLVLAFYRLTRRTTPGERAERGTVYAVQSAEEGCAESQPVEGAPPFFVQRRDPNGARLLFPCDDAEQCQALAVAPPMAMVRATVPPTEGAVEAAPYLLAPAPLDDPTIRAVREGARCRHMRHTAEFNEGAYTLELSLGSADCNDEAPQLQCTHRRTYRLVPADGRAP